MLFVVRRQVRYLFGVLMKCEEALVREQSIKYTARLRTYYPFTNNFGYHRVEFCG